MGVQINGSEGNVVATKGTYSGNVTIGGTLTYEDVTNIDSVGLVTARTGIEIGARPGVAASISVDGNMIVSGISTFGGDVQVPDKIIHSGDTNTAIRFPAADTITAETAGSERIRIKSDGSLQVPIGSNIEIGQIASSSHADGNAGSVLLGIEDGGGAMSGVKVTNVDAGTYNDQIVTFLTAQGGVSTPTERLRITSGGEVGINCTPAGMFEVQKNGVPSIISNYNNSKHIRMSVGGSGGGFSQTTGNFFAFQHQPYADRGTDNNLTERLRITSEGALLLSTAGTRRNTKGSSQYQALLIEGTGNDSTRMSMIRSSNDDNGAEIQIIKTRGTSVGSVTKPNQNDYLGSFVFLAGDDSDLFTRGAEIGVQAKGTPANDRCPSDIIFSTTPTSGASTPQERLRISSAGYVTKPETPSFFATINGGDNTTNNGGTIPFNVVKHNNGNHFDTSTYKFVAPVSGFYYFFVQIWAKNSTTNARFHYRIEDASNSYAGDNITQNGFHANSVNNNDRATSASVVYQMDTGDRIFVQVDNTNLTYYTAGATDPHTYFCGYLIG